MLLLVGDQVIRIFFLKVKMGKMKRGHMNRSESKFPLTLYSSYNLDVFKKSMALNSQFGEYRYSSVV